MATEHTPEPWIYAMPDFDHEGIICGRHGGQVIDGEFNEANARRIVACVNACAGIPDEQLYDQEPGCLLSAMVEQEQEIMAITKQRDELLAALDTFISEHEECEDADGWMAFICSPEAFHVACEAADSVKAATCGEPGKLTKTECSEGGAA